MASGGEERGIGEKEFIEILDHDIRVRILDLIHDRVEVSYTEILENLKVGQGTLNFHLRKLVPLLRHTSRGTYILSERGRMAVQIIHTIRNSPYLKGAIKAVQQPILTRDLVLRRISAFMIDALVFFFFTGAFFDLVLWSSVQEAVEHLAGILELHPWLFHPEHVPLLGELTTRLVGTYAHIFFAVYIFVTAMEAFKGQTPGKYVLGIRVVKVDGGRVELLESAIRNAGKVFLLPLDLIVGVIFYRRRGFLRFFDFYTEVTVERAVPQEKTLQTTV